MRLRDEIIQASQEKNKIQSNRSNEVNSTQRKTLEIGQGRSERFSNTIEIGRKVIEGAGVDSLSDDDDDFLDS